MILPRADTKHVSALQLLPLLPVLLMVGSVFGGWNTTALGAAVLLTALIQFLVARADSRELRSRGVPDRAPTALAAVSSALYLHVRARRCAEYDYSASSAVPWAVAATVVAVAFGLLGTLLSWGLAGLHATVGTEI
jgi:hypothetical protein